MSKYVLDWETFYDSKRGYTLRKMTTEEYINDPRFHCFGFSILRDGGQPLWVPEEKIDFMLRQLKLHEHTVIMHNAKFDAAILNWKFGVRPKFIIDTLAMARGVIGGEEPLSLDALATRFNLGRKGDAVVHMDGVRYPGVGLARRLGEYAKQDAALTWRLFEVLYPHMPAAEMLTIDITTRMFSEPAFALNRACIAREIQLGDERRAQLLESAQCTIADLRSDAKFAALLERLGVAPPKKLSPKKSAKAGHDVFTWAFAKSDADFKAMLDHENEMVRWACEARLGLKSTIKESRAQRFLGIADRMGVLPVALDYYGAHTGRFSASSSAKINMQNLPAARGKTGDDVALLRKAVIAPPGKVVVVADASQIEARFVVWQAGQANMVEAFSQGRDVYSEMASIIFGRHVDRKANKEDFIPGFIGKAVVLGCGYGMGHMKFASMIYVGMLGMQGILFETTMAEQLGVNAEAYANYIYPKPDLMKQLEESRPAAISPEQWILHCACAFKIINTFRKNNPAIVDYWSTGTKLLDAMYFGTGETISRFPTEKDRLLLPNGMWLNFKELERSKDGEYSCLRRKEGRVQRVKTYGGSVVENLTQAMAGAYIKEAMVRAYLRGYRTVLQVHDELVVLADVADADNALSVLLACMTEIPKWAPGIPLAAEGDYAVSYGDAK